MIRFRVASMFFIVVAWLSAAAVARADVQILLPQNRTAFQTNEWIDVSVVRSSDKELAEGTLSLLLEGIDGGKVVATFAAPAVKTQNNKAASTMHLHLSGWLLRPGKYKLIATVDGGKAATDIEVFSHIRQSSFKLINWGRAKGKEQLAQGEDGLGFNTFYGHYGQDDDANFIRGGIDYIANCVMSGGHQMDLRLECDWSDPFVIRGGTRRVVRRAMMDRTRPNVPGVHFYDEPGLTWGENPENKEFTPHAVKAQADSYKAAFGKDPLPYTKVDPKNPEHVERWKHWITWRLGFMDAAWRDAQFGVSSVRPDFLSLTQSQYGFSAFTDGYYFNVARSLPVTSGHGGYHDFGPGFFNPSYFMEISRARDYWKPCWYLPTWYGNTTNDQYRCEQYLSFQTHLQGMICPPDLEPATNPSARAAIVETNQLMKRLGPIFTTMPVSKPPVAMLYSLSQAIYTQTQDRKRNYAHDMPQGVNLPFTYLAGKLIQQPFLCVVDEDIIDGTLANDHKAIVLTSIDYLDPGVVKGLEDFAQRGGLVLLTGDSTVQIKGATKLGAVGKLPDQELINKLQKEKGKEKALAALQSTAKYLDGAKALAKAIQAELAKKKIKPVFECDNPHIVATRQAAGEIEYFFAVNATPESNDPMDVRTALKAASARIAINGKYNNGFYDAVVGGRIAEDEGFIKEGDLRANIYFGPGQMRVFARTRLAIGGIRLATPLVVRELVVEKEPITVEIAATLADSKGRTISGSAPIHIQVVDALGVLRHELFRATQLGQFSIRLPLAANDPAGRWKVIAREGLGNNEDVVEFDYKPPVRARAIAGETHRAVFLGEDANNIFRFARNHHEVTIVKGTSAFHDAAVARLTKILEPWGIKCKTMDLKEAAKPRKLTDEEAKTWVGLTYAGKGQIKPGEANPPILAGFAVQGPVILLGSPGDNPIIDFLHKEKFLPYNPDAQRFPGPNRGYLAWQRDGLGANQESVTLIAYDEAGIQEAVGTFYEAVAGIEPLTKWKMPESDAITPAKDGQKVPGMEVVWKAKLPDRVVGMKATGQEIVALSYDGTRAQLAQDGKDKARQILAAADLAKATQEMAPDNKQAEAAKKFARADRMFNFSAVAGGKIAIAHWGGTLRIVDEKGGVLAEMQLPQDITALVWAGDVLIVGLADGRVQGLKMR